MRHIFLPACLCLIILSSRSGSDIGSTPDRAAADDNRIFGQIANARAEEHRLDGEETPAEALDTPAADVARGTGEDPKLNAQPSATKNVVPRTRQEICDMVATTARSNELPVPFFIHLLFQESGFKSDVVSRAGAQGIAQFMPETAATVGLHNPFDPLQAIAASARLLGNLVRQFGNLGLAAAAYNAGPRRIQDWLANKGKLPAETKDYVKVITGRSPESWTGHASGELPATLPREAPCQEAAAKFAVNLTERRRQLRATERRRVDAAIPAKNLDWKFSRFSAEKTSTIMVAERGDGKRGYSHRDRPDRHKGKAAIQFAASSKKGERKIQLSRR